MTTSTRPPPEQLPPPARASNGDGHGPRRPPTAVIAGAVVVALAGLVAVASHGTPVWTSLRDGRADRSEILAYVAVVGGMGLIAGLAVTLIVHRTLIAKRAGAPPLRATLLRGVPITIMAVAVLALLAITRMELEPRAMDPAGGPYASCASGEPCVGVVDRDDDPDPSAREDPPDGPEIERGGGRRANASSGDDAQVSPESAEDGETDSDDDSGNQPDSSALGPILLIVLGAVALAIAGATVRSWYANRLARREHRGDDDDRPRQSDRVALGDAVARTIDTMLADPDPNTAIIGAYARLLQDLAASEVGRRDHEAPTEHLQRALATLHVRPEPLRRLIGLFEIARFSTHPLTNSHRDQALEALHAAAADLAVGSPSQPAAASSQPIGALR